MTARVSRLDNGATVLSVEGDASATAMLFVGAGSRYETREVAGTAHFLEHLFFKGTPRRPSTLQIATEVDSIGGVFNAFTSKEYTAYFVKCAGDYIAGAVDVIADMLNNALLDPEEIDRERGVIQQEMRLYHDQPSSWVGRLANQLLYGDTPLGWDIVGFEDVIGAVRRDAILAYREQFYAPARMTLAIAGPISHDEALELGRRHFESVAARHVHAPASAVYGEARVAGEERDVQQAAIQLVMPGPAIAGGERDLLAAHLATLLLGGSMSSRLFISVRERQGLCYHIGAGLSPHSDAGALTVVTGVDPGRAGQAVAAIRAELDRFVSEGVTEDEVAKARAMYKGRYAMGREDSMSLAMNGALDLLNWGRVREQAEMFKLADSIGAAEIGEVAERWFHPERMRLAMIGPPGTSAGAVLESALN